MAVDVMLINNDFFIEPAHRLSNLLILKQAPKSIFESVFDIIFNYFQELKRNRTVDQLNEAIELVKEHIQLDQYQNLSREKTLKEIMTLNDVSKKFIENNAKKIETLFFKTKARPFLMRWILAFDEATLIFSEFIREVKKRKYLVRLPKLFDFYTAHLLGALFLVHFRIIEQVYLIGNNIYYDENEEKAALLEDIVYLENLQRNYLYNLLRRKES